MQTPIQIPKILNVDDNEANRYTMKRILQKHGYEVIDAVDAKEALLSLENNPDLVILDVHLPDMSGFDICRLIKAQSPSLPVLHVSANFVEAKDKVEGLESGADGYLAQPIDSTVLVATVKSLLRVRSSEREQEKLIEKLKEERELRERFVNTLTHDLRSPLATAMMNADLLNQVGILGEKEKQFVNRIQRNLHRTDLMIQDLLDVSLLNAGQALPMEMSLVDLTAIVHSVADDFAVKLKGRLKTILPDAAISGYWNASGLRRVLDNLLTNAIKYGSYETPVELEVASGEGVVISVKNFGNPIPIQDQQRLFDQFQRSASAKSSGKKGWGLGLSLVKGVVDAHGGSISLRSDTINGTVFTLRLPRDSRS